MKKQHVIATIIISLMVIGGVVGLSACASIAAAQSKNDLEAKVHTAVVATLVQYMIETQVAAQSLALVSGPAAQVTSTPLPTPTPVPTESAQPTVAATVAVAQPTPTTPPTPASSPKIIADQNTNCRVGPGTGYAVETYFLEGSESTVEGIDAGKDWWYIVNPTASNDFCWVWDGSTTVVGDTSTLPVVAAPADVSPKSGYSYYGYYVYNPYGCNAYHPYDCANYYPYHCGKKVNWWACNPYVYCKCKPVFQNPCKKWGCPPVTIVNVENYCENYPKCCE